MDISKPIIDPLPSGYKFLWCEGTEWVLTVSINRMNEDSHHAVSGEITVEHEPDGVLLSGIKFNLSSQRGRNDIVKRLSQSQSIKINWVDLIEQVCSTAIEKLREGEDSKEIWSHEDVEKPPYLLEPILYQKTPTIIFGEGGSGKSRLARVISMIVIMPLENNNLGLTPTTKSVPTLYIDYETNEMEFRWDWARLAKGLDISTVGINYLRCYQSIADAIDQIQLKVASTKSEFVVVDSLAPAAGGNINEAEPAIRLHNALRKLNTSVLVIGHTSKDQLTRTKSVYGSVFFTNLARSVFECKKQQEAGEDDITIGLFHRKANMSKLHLPMGFSFHFNEDAITVSREDLRDTTLVAEMGTQVRIKELLKVNPLTTLEIMETLDISRTNADVSLKRLKDKKVAIKSGDKWGLIRNEDL